MQTRSNNGIAGKCCVISGASRGIGKGLAVAFAAEKARVAVLDIREDAAQTVADEITAAGGEALAIGCDVSDLIRLAEAQQRVVDRFGPAEILINNAAIFRTGPLEEFNLNDWNLMLSVNLTGYFLCSQIFGRDMIGAGRGSIINIASLSAEAVVPNMGPYSAAKAAVTALTKQFAIEWGPKGIRCNAVHPGMIETPATQAAYSDPERRKGREQAVPLGRTGLPEDIAQAAIFLAGDQAAYINGATLMVDGGFGENLINLVPRLPSAQ